MLADLYAPLTPPEDPPFRLMAGYVITGVTAVRLSLKLQDIDPDNPPEGSEYVDYRFPPPGTDHYGNPTLIKESIREFMATKGLESDEIGVAIAYIGSPGEMNTMIVTQSGFLPHDFNDSLPEVKKGKREKYVSSLEPVLMFPTGEKFEWEVYKQLYEY